MPKTIKLDAFRYITNEGWRALTAIEMGLKNHEVVPIELAQKISRCKRTGSGFLNLLRDQLTPNGLIAFEADARKCVRGYRLTNLGYDYLALHQLFNSGQLIDLRSMIGAGKESDVYLAVAGDFCGLRKNDYESDNPLVEAGSPVVVKFHRLGRTSFRKVKEKRDYHLHRNTCSWLYLDRLASEREFTMMKALYEHGLPVPIALAHNRNAVVMSYIPDSAPLSRILPSVLRFRNSSIAKSLYKQAVNMLHRMASVGLIHGDLNEFNLMVTGLGELVLDDDDDDVATSIPDVKLVLIDFPQMISRNHPSAPQIYERDWEGIVSFFSRFFDIPDDEFPMSLDEVQRSDYVDVQVKAPGFPGQHRKAARSLGRSNHAVLLGSTAVELSTDSEDDGSDQEQSSELTESSDASSQEDSVDETSIEKDVKPVSSNKHVKKQNDNTAKEKSEMNIIGVEEIRAKHKQERRQKEQQLFQRQVKRHNRAHVKRQSRNSLKAELTLFGV